MLAVGVTPPTGRVEKEDGNAYLALAADYDGTLVMSGSLSVEFEAALERLRSSGRR